MRSTGFAQNIVRSLFTLAALALGSSCVSSSRNTVDVEGHEEETLFGSFRSTWELIPRRPFPWTSPVQQREELPPPVAEGTLSLDLEVSVAEEDFRQDLNVTEQIVFDNTTFPGPSRVKSDADLGYGSFSVRGGVRFLGQLRLEGLTGLTFSHFDLELESALQREGDHTNAFGPHFGLQLGWDPLPWIGAHARGTHSFGAGSGSADVEMRVGEIVLRVTPIGPLTLFAGYRWLDYQEQRSGSDVDLDFEGPVLGVNLNF